MTKEDEGYEGGVPTAVSEEAARSSSLWSHLSLRHLLFGMLIVVGIVPLALNGLYLIRQFRQTSRLQETSALSRTSEFISQSLSSSAARRSRELRRVGRMLQPQPDSEDGLESRGKIVRELEELVKSDPELLLVRILNSAGRGPGVAPSASLDPRLRASLDEVYRETLSQSGPTYRFVATAGGTPRMVVAVRLGEGEERWVAEGLYRLARMREIVTREAAEGGAVFLLDERGNVLWQRGSSPAATASFEKSQLVQDFARYPLNLTGEYDLRVGDEVLHMVGQVSPIEATGWAVVVQRPAARSYAMVRRMVWNTGLATALLVCLALFCALWMARQLTQPIRELATRSRQIAGGEFGRRVEVSGPGVEIDLLARSFNRMSQHVEEHVQRLQFAAHENEELFLGTVRSMASAIDARDPYTRGHSERVATVARTLAAGLSLSPNELQRIWIGALLHDVGKIGIADELLRKAGRLTEEEFEVMKRHPVIGAEILESIERLEEILPIVRWHHESWDGSGYPDGLEAQEIPLGARIVAVADTFDAITTDRPYQRACSISVAVETLSKLANLRYDAEVIASFLRAHRAGEIQIGGGEFDDLDASIRRAFAMT